MDQLNLDIVVTRGAIVESRHCVHAAVVNATGSLIAAARETDTVAHWRSCAKPFQVMPLLESGGFDQIGWGDDQLALACASHGGEPEHVAIVRKMLESIGMEEGDLACGPHDPLAMRGISAARKRNPLRRSRAGVLIAAWLGLWWNWQTRYFEVVVPKGVQVQVLLSPPIQNSSVSTPESNSSSPPPRL